MRPVTVLSASPGLVRAAPPVEVERTAKSAMTNSPGPVTGGVDTHGETHHAAMIDQVGRPVADAEFPTTPAGYRALLASLRTHGQLEGVGVEDTGPYGAALGRYLRSQGVVVVEVDRPDRKTRRTKGKSDPIDAYAAARAALSGAGQRHPEDPRRQGRSDPRVTKCARQRGQGPHPGDQPAQRPARHRARRAPGTAAPAGLGGPGGGLRRTEPRHRPQRARRTRSRPRCAGWPPASRRSTPRSPRPTANSARSCPRPRPAWSR